jgi:hypothetical protein
VRAPIGAAPKLAGHDSRTTYKYSESRAAHWILLLAATGYTVLTGKLFRCLKSHPDNPITGTGIKAEIVRHGLSSGLDSSRLDRTHTWIDPILVDALKFHGWGSGSVPA